MSSSNNCQQVYLIRGLPGSGKSTLAALLATTGFIHLETDNYFIQENGSYVFDPFQIKEAHDWCQREFRHYLNQGNNIVVSNTFTQGWEMQFYIQECLKRGIMANIVTCDNRFSNTHNVPDSTITKMRKRWEIL